MPAFENKLQDREFVLGAVVPGIVARLHESVRPLQPGEVYSYKLAPRQGGEYSVGNLVPTAIEAHFNVMGRAYAPH